MDAGPGLEFEREIVQLENQLAEQEREADRSPEHETAVRELRKQLNEKLREVYANLSPWQTVQVARHQNRPYTRDYLKLAFDDFVELHGDKHFGDDRAMLTGFAKLDRFKVMIIGHQKGRTYKERAACHFGCAHPEGYRKAMSKMRLAEKYRLPLVCFIDTPGASPGIGVGDRIAVLQHAYYSVISPEGCAGILWKSHQHAPKAAAALRFTSGDLKQFGVVDDVLDEPLGGAHRDHHQMASRLKSYLSRTLTELEAKTPEQLVADRYEKFRRIGVFLEEATA